MGKTRAVFSLSNHWFLLMIFGFVLFMACQKESRGFVLPEGNIAAGKQMFTAMNCTDCHAIADLPWAGTEENGYPEVKLGGEVTSLKTYGELVTSVINPSHKISQKSLLTDQQLTTSEGGSKMSTRLYNEVMTVQQLVDIVAFLQSEYKLEMPTNSYPYK